MKNRKYLITATRRLYKQARCSYSPAPNSRNPDRAEVAQPRCRRAEPLSISDISCLNTSGSSTRPCFFPNGWIIWGRDRIIPPECGPDLVFGDVDTDVARTMPLVRYESPDERRWRRASSTRQGLNRKGKIDLQGPALITKLSVVEVWRAVMGGRRDIPRMSLRRTSG